jgi:hypothetical protein
MGYRRLVFKHRPYGVHRDVFGEHCFFRNGILGGFSHLCMSSPPCVKGIEMEIKKVGVLGCGLMGSGIAQVCAMAGFDVTVLEVEQKFLDKGFAGIEKSLRRAELQLSRRMRSALA